VSDNLTTAGWTIRDVARRYRVSADKVRRWVKMGRLGAINTSEAQSGRPRYVVLPEQLAAFERGRAVGPVPKARRKKKPPMIDYYP
jgi:transposase